MPYDLFISHATEDKDDFVRPLAQRLVESGLAVWYDELSLKPGDSLRQSIDKGLSESKYGLVVFSPNFFSKKWTQWELDGLVQRHLASDHTIIIPIWHNIDANTVYSLSPSLANIVAVKSTVGIDRIAEQVVSVIKPFSASAPTPSLSSSIPQQHKELPPSFRKQITIGIEELYKFAMKQLKLGDFPERLVLYLLVPVQIDDKVQMELVASSKDISPHLGLRLDTSYGITGYAFRRANKVEVADVKSLLDGGEYISSFSTIRSEVAIPIISKSQKPQDAQVLAVLDMQSDQPNFFGSRRNKEFFESFNQLSEHIMSLLFSVFYESNNES